MNGDQRNAVLAAVLAAGMVMPGIGTDSPSAPAPAPVFLAQAETGPPSRPDTDSGAEPSAAKPESAKRTQENRAVMSSGVPEGFEAYMAPQKTLVDVYFGGRFILSAMAEYTPDTIEFLNPEKIIRALPDVTARPVLLNHFRGPLPTHGDRVCVRPGQSDCGTISPDFIGVIFDERQFRADVFVHPDLMAEAEAQRASYLGEPGDGGAGLVQNLNFNHAGSNPGDDRFSLFGRTRAGYGTQHLFSSWVSTDDQGMSVDELGFRKDFPDHQLNMGLYEPETDMLTILRRQPIAGVGLKRSFKRRQDVDSAFATDVEVFLTARSRVELLRDGRLYDARFYEAGNRKLDTSRLPTGAYNLQVRVTDTSGRTRTLERFFVKSRRLAPSGEYLWFSNVGRVYQRDPLDEFPEDAGTMLATGGVQYRHRDRLGLGVAAAAIEDAALLELTADWLSPSLQTFGSFFASTEGGAGWLVRGSGVYEDMRLILDSQRVWAEEPDEGAEYVLLPDTLERDSIELRVPGTGGQYFASWRRIERNDTPEQRIATLGFTRTMRVGGHQTLNFNTSLSRANGDNRALVGVDWRYVVPQWQHQAQLTWRDSDVPEDETGVSARAASTWQDGNTFVDDLQLTAAVEGDKNSRSLSLDGQHTWQYGRGRAGATRNSRDDFADQTLTSASYDTNLVVTAGDAAVGGPELNEAGVVIDLSGAEGALFDVLVDGKKRFVARGGHRAALTLPGYDSYKVSIRDRGTNFVHYDNSSREITLYPGNVVTLEWKLERIIIMLGTLTRPDGTPLGDVIIEGTRGVTTTDPDGYFQGEIRGADAELFARMDGEQCRLDTGPIQVANGVARLGRVVCRPVDTPTGKKEAEATGGETPDATRQ